MATNLRSACHTGVVPGAGGAGRRQVRHEQERITWQTSEWTPLLRSRPSARSGPNRRTTASIRKVQGAFERTWWEGSDKQAFVGEWATSRGQLEKAAALLLDAANKLDKNRQEQESTSGR